MTQRIVHPYMDEGPFTDEVLVGDIPLSIGQSMTYVFDFGDSWTFDLVLEQVDPEKTTTSASILESHGEPPEQYPTWDDDYY